ncbi:M23 family metallopeptidase [Cohnella sp. LGH]|uniref:M23 family metallopeptidase n=1 Tax=Cohnella sp. LGH TaxID=1619153 RepID=UPI001ADBD1D4|nr:M23 family metallopeptidase [Cohnella sp. LGH]QTH40870.1 M23 family metallopeptidase [Cohnella sp. LGH]
MNKKLSLFLFITLISTIFTTSVSATYNIRFGGVGPGAGTLNLATPITGYPDVNSQWNQPRLVDGSNPHQGVDLYATSGTRVNAICNGFVTYQNDTTAYELALKCDVNGDGLNNDNLEIYYDHLDDVGFVGTSSTNLVTKGTQIAESGNEGGKVGAHLHYGTRTSRSGTMVWTRTEPYYRWTSNWNYGRDLDFISLVTWTNNVAKVVAYEVDSGVKSSLNSNSVTLYHRKDGTSNWISVQMTKSGDNFSYDLNNVYTTSEVVNWMVKADNPHTAATYKSAFMIPKYDQPSSSPNSTSNKYDYYKCTMGGSACTAIVTP